MKPYIPKIPTSLKEIHKENWKSKSSNPSVLVLYNLMLSLEKSDSDYFSLGYASNDVVDIFERHFEKEEWIELSLDLENWTKNQLELFTQAILGGYHGSNYLISKYFSDEIIFEQTQTIQNRLELIIKLIDIEKKRLSDGTRSSHADITYNIFQGLDFINDHFEIFLKKDRGNLETIKKIVALLKIYEWKDEESIKLIENIKTYEERSTC